MYRAPETTFLKNLLYLSGALLFTFFRLQAQPASPDERKVSELLTNQDYEGLREYLSPSQAADSGNRTILGYLGYADFMLGNFRGSEIYFQRILDDSPDDVNANRFLASIYLQLNPEEAEKYLYRLIALQPRGAQAYRDLGDLFLRRNENDSAFLNYRMGYMIEPTNIKSVTKFAGALLREKMFNRADSVLAGISRSGDSLNPVYLRISLQAAYESGKFENAIDPGEKLILLRENSNSVLNQLVISYCSLKKNHECIRVCEYLRLMKTANELTIFYESQAYAAMSRFDSSSVMLHDCLSLAISPGAERYFYNLAQNSERTGRFNKAIAYYDTAYYLFKNPMMLYNQGRIYDIVQKDQSKANQFFRRFLKKADRRNLQQRDALEYVKRRFRSALPAKKPST